MAGNGWREQKARRQRQHEDGGPQRRRLEGIAVQGQPDALQPDDEHELQAAAGDAGEEIGEVAIGEGRELEQPQVQHRPRHALLDQDEGGKTSTPTANSVSTFGLVQHHLSP